MGSKRPSIRTLPSGERVMHYPDGHQELIRDSSPISDMLGCREEELHIASQELAAQRLEAVDRKRESLDAGNPVPHDKRVV